MTAARGAKLPRTFTMHVYLDNAATTRPAGPVIDTMTSMMTVDYGNPSSRHPLGLAAEKHLVRARQMIRQIAGANADTHRVIFTSGGTEAIALAMLGTAALERHAGHLLVSEIEHDAVRLTAQRLAPHHRVDAIPIRAKTGQIDLTQLQSQLTPQTFFAAIMHVNNETGIWQPVQDAIAIIRQTAPQCRILVDAVQSFGRTTQPIVALGADFVATSAHKIHGPKGVGALIAVENARLQPLWGGGQQESGLRPGTENLPAIAGFGHAARIFDFNEERLQTWHSRLVDSFIKARPSAYVLGVQQHRAAHIFAIALPDLPAEIMVNALAQQGIFVSTGSACHSRKRLQSHVLTAMRIPKTHGVIRVSFGAHHTADEIDYVCDQIPKVLTKL